MSGVQAMMQPMTEQSPQGQPQRPTNRSATINGTRRWAAVAIKGKQPRPKGVQAEASNAA